MERDEKENKLQLDVEQLTCHKAHLIAGQFGLEIMPNSPFMVQIDKCVLRSMHNIVVS